jgi:cobalt-zinc-cadmium efflux system protein
MGEGHSHGDVIPSAAGRHRKPLSAALALTLTYMTAEIVGGIVTGSLALIADAAHMATDAGGLTLALFAIHFAQKPANPQKTYGYHVPRSSCVGERNGAFAAHYLHSFMYQAAK